MKTSMIRTSGVEMLRWFGQVAGPDRYIVYPGVQYRMLWIYS